MYRSRTPAGGYAQGGPGTALSGPTQPRNRLGAVLHTRRPLRHDGRVRKYETPAEERLLDAIRAGQVCDFSNGAPVAPGEMANWGPDRTISATLLRQLLLNDYPDLTVELVELRGATIDGDLDLRDAPVVRLTLTDCRLNSAWFSGASFAYTSRYEGFGLPPLEACACGAPLVASSIPPLRETLEGAAELVRPGRIDELAEVLDELAHDDARRHDLARRGLERAQGCSWVTTARRTAEVYRSLVSGA